MGLLEPGTGNLDEAAVILQILEGDTTRVPHTGTETADELVDIRPQGAAQRHHPFDSFGYQLDVTVNIRLEVTVLAPFLHGADGAHAAVALVGAALVEDGITGGLFRPGKKGADHDDIRAGSNRLCQVAGIFDSAVGNNRHTIAFRDPGAVADRRNLRHADTGNNAGRTDGARTDPHLDGIGTRLDQRFGSFGSGNIAGNDLKPGEIGLGRGNRFDYPLGVAVGGIDHYYIHTGFYQSLNTFFHVRSRTHSRAHTQTTKGVLAGIGVFSYLFNILDGDEPFEKTVLINHQQFLHPGMFQMLLGLFQGGTHRNRHQVFLRHPLGNKGIQIRFKAEVAVGENTDQLAVGLGDRHTGDAIL